MKLSDIHKMNVDSLESDRVIAVTSRAEAFARGYTAARSVFEEVKRKDGFVRHKEGSTEITPHGECLVNLVRLKTFKQNGDVFRHRTAPIYVRGIGVWGARRCVVIAWGGLVA